MGMSAGSAANALDPQGDGKVWQTECPPIDAPEIERTMMMAMRALDLVKGKISNHGGIKPLKRRF